MSEQKFMDIVYGILCVGVVISLVAFIVAAVREAIMTTFTEKVRQAINKIMKDQK